MTLERCRELLGPESDTMSDEVVAAYLQETSAVCDTLLELSKNDILFGQKLDVTLN